MATLPSGGNDIRIRSDLSSCLQRLQIEMDVELPVTMVILFGLPPTIEKLPYDNTEVEANMEKVSSIRLKLQVLVNHVCEENTTDSQTLCAQIHSCKTILGESIQLLPIVEAPSAYWDSGISPPQSPLSKNYVWCSHRYKKILEFLFPFHQPDQKEVPPKPLMVVADQLLDRL